LQRRRRDHRTRTRRGVPAVIGEPRGRVLLPGRLETQVLVRSFDVVTGERRPVRERREAVDGARPQRRRRTPRPRRHRRRTAHRPRIAAPHELQSRSSDRRAAARRGAPLNPSAWVGLAFVASAENAHLDTADVCIRVVAPQIAWGQRRPSIDPDLTHAKRVIADCYKFGMRPSGWAWCDGPNVEAAQAEARYHAQIVLDLSLSSFVCNMEEPYDAHGDQSSGRWQMANAYAQAFRQVAGEV